MKRNIVLTLLVVFICTGLLISCSKKVISTENAAFDSRMSEYKVFVVTNNNDTIKGTKWNIKAKKGHWFILIDDKRYIDTSVLGFQSPYGVATRFQEANTAHSFIDQWAYLLRRGKINLYSNDSYTGRRSYYNTAMTSTQTVGEHRLYFYYKMNDLFYDMNVTNLRILVKDHPAAFAAFNESNIKENDKDFITKLFKIIDVYNG